MGLQETPETSVLGSSGWGSLDTQAWTTFGFNALYGQVEDVGYANLPIRQQVKPPAPLVRPTARGTVLPLLQSASTHW